MSLKVRDLKKIPIEVNPNSPYSVKDYLRCLDHFNQTIIPQFLIDKEHPSSKERLVDVRELGIRCCLHFLDLKTGDPRNLDRISEADLKEARKRVGETLWVRTGLAKDLAEINENLLKPQDLELVLTCGYRSRELQNIVIENYRSYSGKVFASSAFVESESPHETGGAVDLVIYDGRRQKILNTKLPPHVPLSTTLFSLKEIEINQETEEIADNIRLLSNVLMVKGIVPHIRVVQEAHHKVKGAKQAIFMASLIEDRFGAFEDVAYYDIVTKDNGSEKESS